MSADTIRKPPVFRPSRQKMPLWLPVFLCILILLFDLATPLGVAAGIAYIPLVFCSLWFSRIYTPFMIAGIATGLIVVGFFASPPAPTEITMRVVVANRMLSIGAIWLVAALVYLRNKTEIARQDTLERHRVVLETTVDGMIVIDSRGIVQSFNPACVKIFGYQAPEVVGNNVSMLMTQQDAPNHDQYLHNYQQGGPARIIGIGREVMGRRKDGSQVPLDLSISEMTLGGERMYSGIVRDISERKRAEAVLQEQKNELQTLFDNLPGIVCYKDDQNRLIRVNKALADTMNVTVEELEGSDTATYFPELADKYYRDDMEVIESGKPKLGIFETIRDGKGELRWIRTDKVPHIDAKTGKRGVIALAQDVTDIKRTEEALQATTQELQRIFDNVPVGIWYKDENNTILRCNRFAAGTTGHTPEELAGRSTEEFFPEMAEKYLKDDREVIASGQPKLGIVEQYTPKHGPHGWIRTDKVPFVDAKTGQKVLIAVAQDITAIKEAEQRLEDMVAQLTSSNEELERFAYICSHDLQEPLRIIRNYVAMLERQCANTVAGDEKAQRYMHYIVDSSERAQNLISDILSYARLDKEARAHERVKLDDIFNIVLQNLAQTITEKKAVVTSDPLPEAIGNPTQFIQLFQNLLGNALKFCMDAPRVHLGAKRAETGWEFSVTDNGIGIDEEYREKIFIIFQRLHRRSDYPGTGIGLAICKKVVQHYGGAIRAESAPGNGTAFCFTLPAAFPDMPTQQAAEKRRQNSSTILNGGNV